MAAGTSARLFLATVMASAGASPFVPACMVEKCGSEMMALSRDNYTSALVSCAAENFGPCASKAWDCLGDPTCRQAATCAPRVFNTCKADIWKMITDEKERAMIMCIDQCPVGKDGHHSPFCVATKCGKSAVKCLLDKTCLHVVECVPNALMACSKSAFTCVFSSDGVCRDNIKCLGKGFTQCSAPGVNFVTDTRVADFVTCAGRNCPHPTMDSVTVSPNLGTSSAPMDAVKQLMCIEAKCPLKVPKILLDQDSKELITCLGKTDFSPVWDCLGDKQCQNSLSCWVKPLDTCGGQLWKVLTDDTERHRIETGASCLRTCEQTHHDDFVQATFCALDTCSQTLLDCYKDETCKSAVKCLPETVADCVMPTLENYVQQELMQKATKAVAKGLEICGRAAVEMLRDPNVADAVRCAAQCTRPPSNALDARIVV